MRFLSYAPSLTQSVVCLICCGYSNLFIAGNPQLMLFMNLC